MISKLGRALAISVLAATTLQAGSFGFPTIEKFDERSRQYGVLLTIPDFPESVAEIDHAEREGIAMLNFSGDQIALLDPNELTFENTFKAYDLAQFHFYRRVLPINILKNASPDEEIRNAASDAMNRISKENIAFSFRDDIYKALKSFSDSDPILKEVDQRLVDHIMNGYRRNGFLLNPENRAEVETLKKNLSELENEFRNNIRKSNDVLVFSANEMAGASDSFLDSVRNEDGNYDLLPNVTYHASQIYQSVSVESTRERFYRARIQRATEENVPILQNMIETRNQIAKALGYNTWSDYRLETRMAENGDTVVAFLDELIEKLEPKFTDELERLAAMKRSDVGDPEAELEIWDITYYREKINKVEYDVNSEAIREYLPYERCLEGMFQIYERVFGVEIHEIENPKPWHPTVSLYAVSDAASEKPLGMFYIDPFPRDGKYNHFAHFSIIYGNELSDGTYQRPTVALICNFPPPEGNRPSLLSFSQLETLFHEFGHCMHSMLTQSPHYRFSGTSVPRDFVEAPSQVMEYWLQDKSVLDQFAAHWEDQDKKLPEEWISKIAELKRVHAGGSYRYQLALGRLDMALHHVTELEEDIVGMTNRILGDIYFKHPEDTARIASFGHLAGYDSGYYGYAWADVIAADLAQAFKSSADGFYNLELGQKLRKSIFEPGNSRDVTIGIEEFLGRPSNMDAFINSLGIEDISAEPKEE